jgi:hypothetical protein
MRRRDRAILTAAVLFSGLALAACETADLAEKLGDVGDKLTDMIPGGGKKPLPGERKPVFPNGIPGVTQGVPPELIKGNQQPEPEVQPPPKQATAEPEKPKPKKRAQAKPKPPAQAAAPVQQAPAQTGAWPAPPPQQPAAAQWPAPPPQPAPQAAWPAPPPQQNR